MIAILWISTLLVSASLAYERRADQGYALPAQGYAIAPATDFGPSAGYGAPQAVPAQGYGAPVPYSGSSYQVPLDYPEEESKWAKFNGMVQKGIKGSMDKQKERYVNMKEQAKEAIFVKKELVKQLKEQVIEHMKSKKQPEVVAETYAAYPAPAYSAPAYPAPAYPAPAPAYTPPIPAYTPPAPAYSPPPVYQAPAPIYGAPTSPYSSAGPASSYSAGPSQLMDPVPVPYSIADPSSNSATSAVFLPSPTSYSSPLAPSFGSSYGN